jgi:ABC-type uncharacterized transport system ATPase subunit
MNRLSKKQNKLKKNYKNEKNSNKKEYIGKAIIYLENYKKTHKKSNNYNETVNMIVTQNKNYINLDDYNDYSWLGNKNVKKRTNKLLQKYKINTKNNSVNVTQLS